MSIIIIKEKLTRFEMNINKYKNLNLLFVFKHFNCFKNSTPNYDEANIKGD